MTWVGKPSSWYKGLRDEGFRGLGFRLGGFRCLGFRGSGFRVEGACHLGAQAACRSARQDQHRGVLEDHRSSRIFEVCW